MYCSQVWGFILTKTHHLTQSPYQTQEELSVPCDHPKKLRNIGAFKTSPAYRASCLLQSCPCSLIELPQYYSLSLFNIVKYSWTVHCHVQLLFANFITVKMSKTLTCQFYHSRSLALFQMEWALEKTNYEIRKWLDLSKTLEILISLITLLIFFSVCYEANSIIAG